MRRTSRLLVAVTAAAGCLAVGTASAGPLPSAQTLTTVYPVSWQGDVWLGRESPVLTQQPAPNHWLATPETIFTDSSGALHLVAKNVAGTWYSAGVTTQKSDYGYGTYRYVVNTPLSTFDPMVVVGMFTYNESQPAGHQEIDVELSRWGQPSATAPNTQFVIQPWRLGDNLRRFAAPTDRALTYEYTWSPRGVFFDVRDGTTPTAPIVRKWRAKATPKPFSGTHVHLNIWWLRGQVPYGNQNQEVVIRSFTYTPAR